MKNLILYFACFLLSVLSLRAFAQTSEKETHYKLVEQKIQDKIDRVRNNPKEHALALETGWYEDAKAKIKQVRAYQKMASLGTLNLREMQDDLGNSFCSGAIPINFTSEVMSYPCGLSLEQAEEGPDYGCLPTTPYPVWFYFQIGASGDITMNLSAQNDLDFIIWGPFDAPTCDYDLLDSTHIAVCSFSATNSETIELLNTNSGEYYMMLVTNFSQTPQFFDLQQTSGNGSIYTTNNEEISLQLENCYTIENNNTPLEVYSLNIEYEFYESEGIDSLLVFLNNEIDTVIKDIATINSPINFLIDSIPQIFNASVSIETYKNGYQTALAEQEYWRSQIIDTSIYAGSDYIFADGTIHSNIVEDETYISSININASNNCDSLVMENIHILPYEHIDTNICKGTDYTFADGTTLSNITATETHTSVFETASGNDSIIVETIHIPEIYKTFNVFLCKGSSYTFLDGTTHSDITENETYTCVLGQDPETGCDSVLTYRVSVLDLESISTDFVPKDTIMFGDTLSLANAPMGVGFEFDNLDDIRIIDSTHLNNSLTYITSEIEINLEGTLTNIDDLKLRLNIEHLRISDLQVELIAPNGQSVNLLEYQPNNYGNAVYLGEPVNDVPPYFTKGVGYDYTFSNTADYTMQEVIQTIDLTPPYSLASGLYRPEEGFESLIGTSISGIWTLKITDYAPNNDGWLFDWHLDLGVELYTVDWQDINAGSTDDTVLYTIPDLGFQDYTLSLESNIFGCNLDTTFSVLVLQENATIEYIDLCSGNSYILPDGQILNNITESTTYISHLEGVNEADSLVQTLINVQEIALEITQDNNGTLWVEEENANYQWIKCTDGSFIDGETNQFFTPISEEEYAVIVQTEFCTDTSDCYTINVEEINHSEPKIQVYPNPAKSYITVSGKEIQKISVRNILGQLIFEQFVEASSVNINVASQKPGTYFISVKTKQGTFVKKLNIK